MANSEVVLNNVKLDGNVIRGKFSVEGCQRLLGDSDLAAGRGRGQPWWIFWKFFSRSSLEVLVFASQILCCWLVCGFLWQIRNQRGRQLWDSCLMSVAWNIYHLQIIVRDITMTTTDPNTILCCLQCAYISKKGIVLTFGCVLFAISDCLNSLGMSCLHVRLVVSFHVTCTPRSVSPWGPLAMSSSRVHSQLWNATFGKKDNGFHLNKQFKAFSTLMHLKPKFVGSQVHWWE